MFSKILIANRGEIACRVIKTAKKMGIHTIAVYSEVDKDAMHVQLADEAYYLGAAPSRESYLCIEKIITIAKKAKADAIHPGYGFLSENPEFARACEKAKIIFIGPSAESIEAMGSKSAAKKLLEKKNIPMTPGYHGDKQELETFKKEAKKINYPILLKAAAGGGGKGMRIVRQENELEENFVSAKREAKASFSDDTLLIEKYLETPRHIEIQIFADNHDNYVYLFERDCSVQRRHQKIIEEAPAINISENLRKKMGEAAIEVARSINYSGAGTVEFLVDGANTFYFMEMNTRLQVEHPVTEMITGLDLVEWQIRVANNEKLPLTQNKISKHGHALEVRICAEDPQNNFLPSIGEITFLETPQELRVDSGIQQGAHITPYYDPMIAKIISYGETREDAIRKMLEGLQNFKCLGVKTNVEFLKAILKHNDFIKGGYSTNFIGMHLESLLQTQKNVPKKILAIASAYYLIQQSKNLQDSIYNTHDLYSPWHTSGHWRMIKDQLQTVMFRIFDNDISLTAKYLAHQTYQIQIDEQNILLSMNKVSDLQLQINFNDENITVTVIQKNNTLHIWHENHYEIYIIDKNSTYDKLEEEHGSLNAPMPGTVVALLTHVGNTVNKGDRLIVIEAMKMEHTITAPNDGVVKEIHFKVGDLVDEGVELLKIENV